MPGPDDLQELMRLSNQGLAEAARQTGVQMAELGDRLNELTAEFERLQQGLGEVRPRGESLLRVWTDAETAPNPEFAEACGVLPGGTAFKFKAETRIRLNPQSQETLSRFELLFEDEESP